MPAGKFQPHRFRFPPSASPLLSSAPVFSPLCERREFFPWCLGLVSSGPPFQGSTRVDVFPFCASLAVRAIPFFQTTERLSPELKWVPFFFSFFSPSLLSFSVTKYKAASSCFFGVQGSGVIPPAHGPPHLFVFLHFFAPFMATTARYPLPFPHPLHAVPGDRKYLFPKQEATPPFSRSPRPR